jgi:hypothetical protein
MILLIDLFRYRFITVYQATVHQRWRSTLDIRRS